jgi:bla regulator protein BlaR1
MIDMKNPSRVIALSISGAVHVVLIAAVVALWSAPAEFSPMARNPHAVSGEPRTPTSLPPALSKNRLHTARSPQLAPDAVTAPETPGPLVPMIVASAEQAAGGRMLNHLWQSTLFALLVGGLTLAFRKHDARVRYWMWFAASVKFLVPFSLLEAVGASLLGPAMTSLLARSATPSIAPANVPLAFAQISQPFTAAATTGSSALTPSGGVEWLPIALLIAWALGVEFVVMQRLRAWRVVRAAIRDSTPIRLATSNLPADTPIRSSPTVLEPAAVGMWRPILLLPAGIEQRLTPAQLDAVIAHEACHILCRDNLTAGIQMLVECVCWFHPMVWWIGGRLIQERERACDEHVLGLLQNPRVYADGIINVCKHYVGAPLPCVPGVSSSDLRLRIERIMRHETGESVPRRTRIALGIAASLILIVPIVGGAVTAPPSLTASQAPGPSPLASTNSQLAFQAASIKQNVSGSMFTRLDVRSPGRFTATNVPAAVLVRFAYGLEDFEVVGAPRWLESDRYDVVASSGGDATVDQKRAMLRQVLQDRFGLSAHADTRPLPIYALMMARNDGKLGPGLRRSATNCGSGAESALGPDAAGFGIGSGVELNTLRWVGSDSPAWPGMPSCGFFGPSPNTNLPAGQGGLSFRGLTMSSLAHTIAKLVHRSVTDETGLAGSYDGDLGFLEELPPPPPPPGASNPFTSPFLSIFTVLPEQLGLKLQGSRGSVKVLVIDAVQRPTPD